jgi:hypothetical protein
MSEADNAVLWRRVNGIPDFETPEQARIRRERWAAQDAEADAIIAARRPGLSYEAERLAAEDAARDEREMHDGKPHGRWL